MINVYCRPGIERRQFLAWSPSTDLFSPLLQNVSNGERRGKWIYRYYFSHGSIDLENKPHCSTSGNQRYSLGRFSPPPLSSRFSIARSAYGYSPSTVSGRLWKCTRRSIAASDAIAAVAYNDDNEYNYRSSWSEWKLEEYQWTLMSMFLCSSSLSTAVWLLLLLNFITLFIFIRLNRSTQWSFLSSICQASEFFVLSRLVYFLVIT